MTQFDVFNGDADGICALHQLRLAHPCDSTLITGVKRDISLLTRVVGQAGDQVTALDISLDKNREALRTLLDTGCKVTYFDHHYAGEIPEHANLSTNINTAADVCTSLLVNTHLDSAHLPWAIVGAFGDNLHNSARSAALPLQLTEAQLDSLCKLGTYLNYNGYGIELSDLLFAPDQLYRRVKPYESPFDFMASEPAYQQLAAGYDADMSAAAALTPELTEQGIALYLLPDAPWARRVGGVFGNQLARDYPNRAHALFTVLEGSGYRVSVRAPLSSKDGADTLCRLFPTGGGRKAAAGINLLPESLYSAFIDAFRAAYQ